MSHTPRINKILLVLYVLLAGGVLAAALIWPQVRAVAYAPLRDLFFPAFFLPTSAGIRATIEVAAPPTLEPWVREAATEFSRQNTLIEVNVTPLRGTEASQGMGTGITGLPDVWIAEADFVRRGIGGVPYESTGAAVAQDSLVWVAVTSRSDMANNLSWQAVFDTAGGDARFSIAVPPVDSVEGMAACMSAAAAYHQRESLTGDLVADPAFQAWLDELLEAAPNRSRHPRDQLGSRPPEADVGLILNSDWYRLPQQSFFHQPPRYNVAFNYPYLIRTSWYELPQDEANAQRLAAEKFRDFLLGEAQQDKLQHYGLERAGAEPTGQIVQVDESAIQVLEACWQ